MPEFIQVKYPDVTLLRQFIAEAGTSLTSFRYFQKRPLEVIQNHACTFLLIENNKPIAYGHLDVSDEPSVSFHCGEKTETKNILQRTIWLGIAVAEKHTGKGLGLLMMQKLIQFAKEQQIPSLRLSVDNSNTAAIRLYEKLGFILEEKKEHFSFYRLGML